MITRRALVDGEFAQRKDREIVTKPELLVTRKLWEMVVNKHLELISGFVNSIHLFEKILGLKLPSLQEAKSKNSWITESFGKIFNTLNPKKNYKIDLQDLKEVNEEFFGSLKVSVFDEDTPLFSFVAEQKQGHSAINAIFDTAQEFAKENNSSFKQQIERIQTPDTAETFWLLAPTELQKDHVHTPLYQLFPAPLQDNDKRINFLSSLHDLAQKNSEFIHDNTPSLQKILSHVIESIGWKDRAVYEKASPTVVNFVKSDQLKDFHDILFSGVTSTLNH